METKTELTNGQLRTADDDSLIRVSSENARQDDIVRDSLEDDPSDGTDIVQAEDMEGKLISDKKNDETKNDCLNNEVSHKNHPEMNSGPDHTAVLQQLQERMKELGCYEDSRIKDLIQNLREEHEREIENIQRSSSEGIQQQEKQKEDEQKVIAENIELIELLKSEHNQEKEELRKTLEDAYQNQVLKISDELRDHYQNDMDDKIAKTEEDWETEFATQKLEFDGRITAVQKEQWTQCQEAIERVTLDAEDQLKNMKHAHDCETAELKRRLQQLLEQQTLSEIKEKELDEEKCQKEEEHIVKIKTMEKQLSGERDEVEAQINVATNEMDALKGTHEREMENLKTELEKKYSHGLSEAKNEMKTKYQAELDEKVQRVHSHLRQQYEQDLEKNKEELHESSITLKTKFEKELAEAVTQLEELHERNQQHELEKTKLKKNYENAKKNMEKLHQEVEKKNVKIQEFEKGTDSVESNDQLKELEEFRNVLDEKKSLEEKLNDVSSQLLSLKEKVEENKKEKIELSSRHATEILEIKSNYEKVLVEKQFLENHQSELSSQILLLNEKVNEQEKEKVELSSNHETEILEIKSNSEKVLVEKQFLENQQSELSSQILLLNEKVNEQEKEKVELSSNHETEILEIKSNFEKVLVEKQFSENQQSELSSQILLLNEKVNEQEKEKVELSSRHATEILEIKSNYEKVLVEKQFLENHQSELTSQMLLLNEKVNEQEKEKVELSSRHATEILEIKSNFDKVLVEKQFLENQVDDNEKEKAELDSIHETETLKIKAMYDKEAAALKSDLEQRNLTIADFEKSSRARELEIANLILNSPLPTESESVEGEFDFGGKPEDRIKRMEIEIVKYKRKITELEDEAEDKFETTSYEEIEKACKAKVEIITTKLETTTQKLNQQTALNQESEEKLRKMEIDLENKSKEYIELSKINKHLDINQNVHTENGMFVSDADQEHLTKEQKATTEKDEDKHKELQRSGQTDLLGVKVEYENVLKENEKFKGEISKKDLELSTLIKEKEKVEHFIQSLKEDLGKREKKCEHLTARAMNQKSNYESEIQLMQKEIGELIQENKEHGSKGKLAEKYQQENLKLQMKIEEMETAMAESSAKHQQEIQELKTIIQSKENSSKDLQKMYQALETSSKEIEINIENLRNQFDEKERELLNEMQEKTAVLEEEKNEILENSFHEKEELLMKISDLESLCKDSSFWLDSDKECEISNRDSNEYQTNTRGNSYSDHHSLSSPLFKEKTMHTDHEGQLGIMDEHHWINRDKQRIMGDQLGYNERVDDILGDHHEPQRENEGYSGNGWKYGESEDNEGYEGIMEDKREQDSEYGIEMVGRYEERVKEYGYKEKEDEYEMGIELLIEKEEGERLRKELGTMTRCVDVFHEECQRLKNSLDNTLDMLNMVKQERNALVDESKRSLEETSEIILDLVKYEDIIKNLEKYNEKLVKEKEMLQRCLLQTTDKPSSVKTLRENYTKAKPDAEIIFPRKAEGVQECRSGKNPPDIQEIDFLKTSEVHENGKEEEEDRLGIIWDFQKERNENRFQKSKPSTGDFVPQQKDRGRNEERKTMPRTGRYSKNDSSFLQNGFSKWESDSWKPESLSEQSTRDMDREYSLGEEVESLNFNPKENSLFLELNPEIERASYVYRSEEDGPKPKQYPELRESDTRKHVTFTSDDAMSDEYPGAMTRGNKKAERVSRSPHRSKSTREQFSEETLHQRNHSKKDAQNVSKGHKISASSSRKSPQVSRNITTPFTGNSQNSKNTSSGSSSFLTSTKTSSDHKLRLVPNLSGVSPIVSQLDRRRHNEMLKWRIADDLSSDVTQNTTFLTTADPTIERSQNKNSSLTKKHKPRKMTPRHVRSISADDRLIYSTAKAPSLHWLEESYLENPLTINFEDFVFRHRVKSSEDVANLRDPSPAELWFS